MSAPSLRTVTRRALDEAGARQCRVVLAVSGGSDSTALLDVMARLAGDYRLELHAHGVDHGLRAAAADELAQVEAQARALAVPFSSTRLTLDAGSNLQARARRARYLALEAVRQRLEARFIATAHHQRDRAETVLLRLLRGAPAAGLGVLPVHEGSRLRPLIHAPKELILAYLSRHRLRYAEDPSNADPRFLRVRIREELLPLLRSLAPGIEQTLAALADAHLGRIDHSPEEQADLALLRSLPRASLTALRSLGRTRSTTARVWLPGGLAARVDGPHDEIRIDAQPETSGKPVRSRTPMKSRSIHTRRSS